MKNALAATMTTLPEQLRRSLTRDRGKELSHEHGFSDLRLQAMRGLARSRDVDLEVVLRAALRGDLRSIVVLPDRRGPAA